MVEKPDQLEVSFYAPLVTEPRGLLQSNKVFALLTQKRIAGSS